MSVFREEQAVSNSNLNSFLWTETVSSAAGWMDGWNNYQNDDDNNNSYRMDGRR